MKNRFLRTASSSRRLCQAVILCLIFFTGCQTIVKRPWINPPPNVAKTFELMEAHKIGTDPDAKGIAYAVIDKMAAEASELLREVPFLEISPSQYRTMSGDETDDGAGRYFLMRAAQVSYSGGFMTYKKRGEMLIYFRGIGTPFKKVINVPVVKRLHEPPEVLYILASTYR